MTQKNTYYLVYLIGAFQTYPLKVLKEEHVIWGNLWIKTEVSSIMQFYFPYISQNMCVCPHPKCIKVPVIH